MYSFYLIYFKFIGVKQLKLSPYHTDYVMAAPFPFIIFSQSLFSFYQSLQMFVNGANLLKGPASGFIDPAYCTVVFCSLIPVLIFVFFYVIWDLICCCFHVVLRYILNQFVVSLSSFLTCVVKAIYFSLSTFQLYLNVLISHIFVNIQDKIFSNLHCDCFLNLWTI